jgi:hypothetical protein
LTFALGYSVSKRARGPNCTIPIIISSRLISLAEHVDGTSFFASQVFERRVPIAFWSQTEITQEAPNASHLAGARAPPLVPKRFGSAKSPGCRDEQRTFCKIRDWPTRRRASDANRSSAREGEPHRDGSRTHRPGVSARTRGFRTEASPPPARIIAHAWALTGFSGPQPLPPSTGAALSLGSPAPEKKTADLARDRRLAHDRTPSATDQLLFSTRGSCIASSLLMFR